MKIFIFILMFFILGALLIISNNEITFLKENDFKIFSNLFLNWFENLFFNLKSVTGQVVSLDWHP